MAWHMTGQLIEACSCKAACPCVLGPAEPDQGWCSGALTFVIQQGESDGVDLRDRKVLWLVDLPNDFASGNGTVRVYIDDGADARQRQELEAIFTGTRIPEPPPTMPSTVSASFTACASGLPISASRPIGRQRFCCGAPG